MTQHLATGTVGDFPLVDVDQAQLKLPGQQFEEMHAQMPVSPFAIYKHHDSNCPNPIKRCTHSKHTHFFNAHVSMSVTNPPNPTKPTVSPNPTDHIN
jgi:hypothetical protein